MLLTFSQHLFIGVPFVPLLFQDYGDMHRSQIPYWIPTRHGLEKDFSDGILYVVPPKSFFRSNSIGGSLHSVSSEAGLDSINGHKRVATMDAFRIILSSEVSSSSQGSGQADGDALGDVKKLFEDVKNLDVNNNVKN